MAKFSTYAEVLTPDHISWKAYIAGIRKSVPGVVLAEILKRTGGLYETQLVLEDKFRAKVRKVAQLDGDMELMNIAELPAVTISLEHLRDVDPQTRIVCGYQLNYAPGESERLGLKGGDSFDPRNTMVISVDPANPQRVES